jgi:hypothetical protein
VGGAGATLSVLTGMAIGVSEDSGISPIPLSTLFLHLGIYREFEQLDELMERYRIDWCVIDGMPETHSSRQFAERHRGQVFLHFFNEHQRGAIKWDDHEHKVEINRTEALDASRAAVRQKKLLLPRRDRMVELFAKQMTADAKKLEFSFAFTYAWMAASDNTGARAWMRFFRQEAKRRRRS